MKRLLGRIAAVVLLVTLVAGCSNDKDKGINKNLDKPTAGPKQN